MKVTAKNLSVFKDVPELNTFALVGFLCSIFALVSVFFIPIVSLLACVLGVVFSAIALKEIKRNPESFYGKGLAVAGLVLGILMFLIFVFIVIVLILLIMTFA